MTTDNPCQFLDITEDEFHQQYPLIPNHINPHASWTQEASGQEPKGCLFETYGQELDHVRKQDPRQVWTLIDGDGHDGTDDLFLVSGLHFVNRIGYLISSTLWPDNTVTQVRLPSNTSETQTNKE